MDVLISIQWIIFSILIGFISGGSILYTFNRIPAKWLCDYGEDPGSEMWGERIKRRPWNITFILLFMAIALKLMDQGVILQVSGIVALWLSLQIGIADAKYRIIPDQFVIALAVTGLGFIPVQTSALSPLYGAMIGGGSFLLIGVLGKAILKKDVVGFGDVKLLASIGLIAGTTGSVLILLLSILSGGLSMGVRLLMGRIKRGEEYPMGPFIVASLAVYLLFRKELIGIAGWYLNYL